MASTSATAAETPAPLQQPYIVLEDAGVEYVAQPGHQAFYDEAAGLIHVVEGRMVTAVALPAAATAAAGGDGAPFDAGIGGDGGGDNGTPMLHTPRTDASGAATPAAASPARPRSPPLPVCTPPRGSAHCRGVSDASSSVVSGGSGALARAFLAAEGGAITDVRASLDGRYTALQRSRLQVEFLDHATGNMFIETPQKKGAELHGFFWTDAPDAEFVLVTSAGLELFSPRPGAQGLRPTGFQRLASVQWFAWSHPARLLVAGCGSSGAKLQPFQISRSGMLRLPLLDLTPPWGSPVRAPRVDADNTAASAAAAPWLQVAPSQVWALVLYRRVMVAHHDVASGSLKLYRLYRDATALYAEIPLSSIGFSGARGGVELSVVDDVLVVHDLKGGWAAAVDVAAAAASLSTAPGVDGVAGIAGGGVKLLGALGPPCRLGIETGQGEAGEGPTEQPPQLLTLFHPDWALDQASGRLLRLKLDLVALADVCDATDAPALLSFLRRRRPSPRQPRQDPRYVVLRVLRRMVAVRAAPSRLRAAFEAALADGWDSRRSLAAAATASADKTRRPRRPSSAAEDPHHAAVPAKEIALGLLAPLLPSGSAGDDPAAAGYLQAALAELLGACYATGALPVDADVAGLYLTAYCAAGERYLLAPLLRSHAALLDSPELADRLEAGAVGCAGHEVPQDELNALAEAMWRRLGDAHRAAAAALQRGAVVAALREASRRGVHLDLEQCLEAAEACGDAAVAAAVRQRVGAVASAS